MTLAELVEQSEGVADQDEIIAIARSWQPCPEDLGWFEAQPEEVRAGVAAAAIALANFAEAFGQAEDPYEDDDE